eukprot:TRINITY_DN8088_c0_g3_i1.p1 TRINITY_DN8088_c0_g3~~TRINITY_DN8088_c0_g3_i1.p1  ORF type:complete len:359 (+),score=46.29 TRINITY_DN8088_c0_g3_i1:165-1241(+)
MLRFGAHWASISNHRQSLASCIRRTSLYKLQHTYLRELSLRNPSPIPSNRPYHTAMADTRREISIPLPSGTIAGWSYGSDDGTPLLAIHGWLQHADCWLPLLSHLPAGFRIIAIDLPGHGKSTHRGTGMGYAVSDYTRDIYALLQHLQLPQVHIMGHSMGAMISFLFAGAFPEHVSTLTLIDGVAPITADDDQAASRLRHAVENWHVLQSKAQSPVRLSLEQARERLRKGNPDIHEDVLPVLFDRGTVRHNDGTYSFSRDLLVKQVTPMRFTLRQVGSFARQIKCPTMAVLATQGLRTAPPEETARQLSALQELMPSLTLAEVEGNHHVHMNDASRVGDVIRPFLHEHRQRSSLKSKL